MLFTRKRKCVRCDRQNPNCCTHVGVSLFPTAECPPREYHQGVRADTLQRTFCSSWVRRYFESEFFSFSKKRYSVFLQDGLWNI